jgi:acetyl esterase/lipase
MPILFLLARRSRNSCIPNLGSADARHPLAAPLHGRHSGMPSTRIHVGDDEVLLDDSLRYVERAVAAGVDARAPRGYRRTRARTARN